MVDKQDTGVRILAIVGLTGSGKSEIVSYITSKDIPKVYFGGVILNAMKERGIDWTEENEKQFREEIRVKEGKDYVVNQIVKDLHSLIDAGQKRIVADGLYTWTEYKTLKREFPRELTVVAVVAPKTVRHHRLTTRELRPLTVDEASKRDWAEIENLEKGGPIAIADYYLINNGSLDLLHKNVDELIKRVEFCN